MNSKEKEEREQEELKNIEIFEAKCKICKSPVYYYKYRVVLLDFSLSNQQFEQTPASEQGFAPSQESELQKEKKLVYLTCEGENTEYKKHTCVYKYPNELSAVAYKTT